MRFKNLAFIALFVLTGFLLNSCSQDIDSDTPALKTFLNRSEKPAVLKFYADWCSTCKSYAPTFEQVAEEMSDSVDFHSINTDNPEYKALLKELKIARIPETVFVSADRENISKRLGPISHKALTEAINNLKTL